MRFEKFAHPSAPEIFFQMDCFSETVSTSLGDVLLHYLVYPNGSVFVWVSAAASTEFDDFHVAVPDKFSSLPAVSSRMGGYESSGRNVALRLSKKLQLPVIVSWSVPAEFEADTNLIESRIFSYMRHRTNSQPVVEA